ncbi:MAG: FAD:protein FMN transferase [Lachnospiraceae bacterium]|nr:FAD:protein FMN transferase [Lachnospiraceae bacterium]
MKYKWSAILLVLALMITGCGMEPDSEAVKNQKQMYAMDTIMDLTLYGEDTGGVMDEAVKLIQRYDSLFSVNHEDSDIARLNAASGAAVTVSEETYELLNQSVEISKETKGLFDISIYPLVKAWGFTTGNYQIPSVSQRQAAQKRIDYKKVCLSADRKVQLEKGMQVDLGAIAKGYLSQKLMELFQAKGMQSALVSLGGNVQTIGTKENGELFQIGITDPSDGVSIYGILKIKDKAVVTSGIYQRYFTKDGKQYHHIMDKRTGMPAENTLASVTVIADNGAVADALATALYVMGEGEAISYQKTHPDIGVILIRKDGSHWKSEGLNFS